LTVDVYDKQYVLFCRAFLILFIRLS